MTSSTNRLPTSVHVSPDAGASSRLLLQTPLLTMALLWTLVPALIHTAPPLDVVESAVWGREWVIGTYKHPAMPAWALEVGRAFSGGAIGWPAYAVAQAFNLATLGLTFALARDVANWRVATAAVLSLLGVEYFSWRSVEFNHTLAQMPFWVAAAWCAWRAVNERGSAWWLALGAMAALGLYAKLSNATLLLVIAGWILMTPRGRASLTTAGPYLGALAFAVLCVPLARWLMATGYQPLEYANARGRDQSTLATLLFPVNAVLQGAPIFLVLGLGLFAGAKTAVAASTQSSVASTPEQRQFLLALTVGPPLLSIVLALAGGSGLRAAWLAPSLPLFAIWLATHVEARLTDRGLQRLSTIGLALAVLLPLGYAVVVPSLNRWTAAPLLRVNWPQAAIARELSQAWTAATNRPLKIVAGSAWVAGLVALDHPDRPSILTDGVRAYAPWITPERLDREGALLVWIEGRSHGAMPAFKALVGDRPVETLRIAFPRGKPTDVAVIRYVVLPPR